MTLDELILIKRILSKTYATSEEDGKELDKAVAIISREIKLKEMTF